MKDLFETDWNAELQDNDTTIRRERDDEVQVVFLSALQRLARSAGLRRQEVQINTPGATMVQAVFSCTFSTGEGEVTFVGTADCSSKNTNAPFSHYPTAVAESRAEARCLRKALGINILSSEEIGFRDGFQSIEADPGKAADKQLVKAVENLCESRGVESIRVIEEVIEDDERAATIFDLASLTTAEAQRAMAWLNEQKPKAPTKTSKRDARKSELKAKVGE